MTLRRLILAICLGILMLPLVDAQAQKKRGTTAKAAAPQSYMIKVPTPVRPSGQKEF